jgi:hypothetical protein
MWQKKQCINLALELVYNITYGCVCLYCAQYAYGRLEMLLKFLVAQFLSSIKAVCLRKNCQAYIYATLAV